MPLDVVVIGAGLAGLACAQQLQQLGLRVVVVEKSRGLGGRLATRRLPDTHADHGVRYLENQGPLTQALLETLCNQRILHPWTNTVEQLQRSGHLSSSPLVYPRYSASEGITAVAKFLGNGLEIWRSQRVYSITPRSDHTWAVAMEPNQVEPRPDLIARAVVMTVPAPQALTLVEPLSAHGLPEEFLTAVRSVEFAPCITTIAAYAVAQQPNAAKSPWTAVTCLDDPDLDWVAIDSTKQLQPQRPVVIIQSTAAFAQAHLENPDLQSIGQQLVDRAAQRLQLWLGQPETLQVHRWRYAFAVKPIAATHLHTSVPLPLVCGGDWCGGANLEAALQSGLRCAMQLNPSLLSREKGDGGTILTPAIESLSFKALASTWHSLLHRFL